MTDSSKLFYAFSRAFLFLDLCCWPVWLRYCLLPQLTKNVRLIRYGSKLWEKVNLNRHAVTEKYGVRSNTKKKAATQSKLSLKWRMPVRHSYSKNDKNQNSDKKNLLFKCISYLSAITWLFMFLSVSLVEGSAFKTRFRWLHLLNYPQQNCLFWHLQNTALKAFYYVQAFPCTFPPNCRWYLSSCFRAPLSTWRSLEWFQFPFSNRESNFWLIGSM